MPHGAPRRHAVDVVADGERREGLVLLPGRREGRRPVATTVEGKRLVGDLELAAGLALEDEVAAEPQHDEVHQAVIVDVERIGAGDVLQVLGRDAHVDLGELERAAGRAVVAIEIGRAGAAGNEQVRLAIAIAVERRHAAADEELPAAGIFVVDAGGQRLLVHVGDVVRHRLHHVVGMGRSGRGQAGGKQGSGEQAPGHCGITRVFRKAMSAERSASLASM